MVRMPFRDEYLPEPDDKWTGLEWSFQVFVWGMLGIAVGILIGLAITEFIGMPLL